MIEVEDLAITGHVHGVSFTLAPGETLGLLGESGSGATAIARAMLRLVTPSAGQIRLDGTDIAQMGKPALRRRVQLIFPDPYTSLDPSRTVQQLLAPGRITTRLAQVGLSPDILPCRPHDLSGGERQRVAIARALAVEPRFLIANDPVAVLDFSVQAEIITLLQQLQQTLSLGLLFIAQDVAVIQHVSDRVAVLYLGRILELAPSPALFARPRHPYTQALLDAAPGPDPHYRPDRRPLAGEIPDTPPSGCVFRTRCPHALAPCALTVPVLKQVEPGHWRACLRDDVP